MNKHSSVPAGLGALLARLASLSKLQTAALCVALAAVPVGWQWKERRQADVEVQWMRARFLTAQTDVANARADLERLRADSTKLEETLAQTNEVVARAAVDAQAFAAWKQETRVLLAAADHGWSDESPLVRIPKAILPELGALTKFPPFVPPGVVNPSARELLGLTREERQAIGKMLQRVAKLQRGPKADVYESDLPVSGRTLAAKRFSVAPPGEVGPEAEQRFAQMLADLRDILGEERWPVVPSRYRKVDCEVLNRMLIPQPTAYITATIESDESGSPQVSWTISGDATPSKGDNIPSAPAAPAAKAPAGNVYSLNVVGYVNANAALSAFLPDADPEQRKKATNFGGVVHLPPAVKQRTVEWLQQQSTTRLGGKEKP